MPLQYKKEIAVQNRHFLYLFFIFILISSFQHFTTLQYHHINNRTFPRLPYPRENVQNTMPQKPCYQLLSVTTALVLLHHLTFLRIP